ncbi:flippase [Paenibacillus sp. Soil787]|uniref:flippase n=1 Tax=Paenibacillus sp. Soil787 TaxID=1736411 RepID=UPI0007031A39|nr:flippase [Paenibacillus sp. Soil787]KRF21594.1 polysaccharide biosynthesis protein [Paenibacillus sp. Soil787]
MKANNLHPESNMARLLAKSGSLSFLLNVAGVGLAVLMQVVLARGLGVTSYGNYAFVMTVITFLVFPANLGFDTAIVRYVSSYNSSQLWGEIKGLLRRANQLTFLASFVIMVISSLVIYVIYGSSPGELYQTFLVSLLVIPLMAVTTLRQSALLAIKEVMFAQFPEKVMRPVCCMAALLLYKTIFHTQASALDAMIIFFGSMILSYLVGAWVLHRKLSPSTKNQAVKYHTKHWLSESTTLMVNSGMYLILGQLSVVMVGMMHGTSESGIFSAAVRIATMVSFAITSINMIAAPIISECYAKGDMKQMQRICTLSGRSGFLFAGLVFLAVLLLGPWLLGMFGEEFRAGQPALLLLSLSHLIHAYCGQSGTVMTMTGQQRASSRYLMIATGMNIVLNLLLIPSMGMVGAATAGLVSTAFCYFSMMVKVKKTMHITTGVWMGRTG